MESMVRMTDRDGGEIMPGLWLLYLLATTLAAILFGACSVTQFKSLQPGLEQRGHHIKGVTFYPQGQHTCGPAALAGIASYWGRTINMGRIAADLYIPELRGTLPADMERLLRETGFITSSFAGTLDDVRARVLEDIPVVCLLDFGFSVYRQPHYVVVIGFDDAHEVVIVHDGLKENRLIRYEKFINEWERAGNWMLVAVPADKDKQ